MLVQAQVFTLFMYKSYQIVKEEQCSKGKEKGTHSLCLTYKQLYSLNMEY